MQLMKRWMLWWFTAHQGSKLIQIIRRIIIIILIIIISPKAWDFDLGLKTPHKNERVICPDDSWHYFFAHLWRWGTQRRRGQQRGTAESETADIWTRGQTRSPPASRPLPWLSCAWCLSLWQNKNKRVEDLLTANSNSREQNNKKNTWRRFFFEEISHNKCIFWLHDSSMVHTILDRFVYAFLSLC